MHHTGCLCSVLEEERGLFLTWKGRDFFGGCSIIQSASPLQCLLSAQLLSRQAAKQQADAGLQQLQASSVVQQVG